MSNQNHAAKNHFLVTKEYRRFMEFCEACRSNRYIGLCYGLPGVGKTLSAKHYAKWDLIEQEMSQVTYRTPIAEIIDCRAIFYTPSVANSPQAVDRAITRLWTGVNALISLALEEYIVLNPSYQVPKSPLYKELLIVDEADRLKALSLEQIRDFYDRWNFGLVLIGMPGIEKRLSRYPQLYSRVGFVHQFRSLSNTEMHFILEHKWQELGLQLQHTDFTDAEAIAAVVRITGGNFRLLQRLFAQIERILQINQLRTITKEVIEAAREGLVIGSL